MCSLPHSSLSGSPALKSPADVLPPPLPWSGPSESLIAPPSDAWITPAETTGLLDTPSYEASVEFLRRLCAASPWLRLDAFGHSAEGRPMYVVIASKQRNASPTSAEQSGLPTVLVQAGLHSGEIEGKDAGFMLLRDIAFRGKEHLLDGVHLLFVPMFNPDGHERRSIWNRPNQRGPVSMGWRSTAQNLNLNRDYVKADAPEMRAMLGLMTAWRPALTLDVHASDGVDHAYDMTYYFHGYDATFAYSPSSGAWLNDVLRPAVDNALRENGHLPGPYLSVRNHRDPGDGVDRGHYGPRYSTGYGDLAHLPGVLLETHSLKDYRRRVLASYVFIEAALKVAGAEGGRLMKAVAADRSLRPSELPLNWDGTGTRSSMTYEGVAHEEFVSPASGAREVRWLGQPRKYVNLVVVDDAATLHVIRPKAYWVPVTKAEVIARLEEHGVAMEKLTAQRTVAVEMLRVLEPRCDAEPFEGRHLVRIKGVKREQADVVFPSGSVRVSTDQPLGDLVVALLEPQSNDSFFTWGFFSEILQRTEYIEGYVIAPLAERMLAADAALKEEFETRLRSDSAFAADPAARLRWFYERSPFYDSAHLLYPVGIER